MQVTNISGSPLSSIQFARKFNAVRTIPAGQTINIPDAGAEELTKALELARQNKLRIDSAGFPVSIQLGNKVTYSVQVKDAVKTAGVTLTINGEEITVGATASALAAATALVAAINANSTLKDAGFFARDPFAITPGGAASADHFFILECPGADTDDLTLESDDGTNAAFALLVDEREADEMVFSVSASKVVAANLVSGAVVLVPTALRSILSYTVQVVRANQVVNVDSHVEAVEGVIKFSFDVTESADNLLEDDVIIVNATGTL